MMGKMFRVLPVDVFFFYFFYFFSLIPLSMLGPVHPIPRFSQSNRLDNVRVFVWLVRANRCCGCGCGRRLSEAGASQ